MNYDITNFIGVFDEVLSKETCDEIIKHYEYVNSLGRTETRKQHENAISINKDNSLYFLNSFTDDTLIVNGSIFAVNAFKNAAWECYKVYSEKYGILTTLNSHGFPEQIKIQKNKPCEGYHVWHCENAGVASGSRMLLVLMYLNDVDSGGETEFLYQSKRVEPKVGRVVICPTGFTHTHRGNPPLSGDKYIMNTWVQFVN
jgi:hypothetical protein